jgi:hypothetical protein
MAHYRVQISFQADSALPKDAITINPHYNGDDAAGIAAALKSNLLAHADVGPSWPFTVKVYDAEKAPPSYPLAEAQNVAAAKATGYPRELALCLSYYATWNRPGFRGRLYIPICFLGGTASLRPSAGQMTKALQWANVLNTGMPPGTIWEVWSPTQKRGSGVSNTWVDDEWDIQRKRGLRGTSRQTADATP